MEGLSSEEREAAFVDTIKTLERRIDDLAVADSLWDKMRDLEQRMAWLEGAMEVQSLIDQRIDRLVRVAQQLQGRG
jgi:hypothetical protein